MKKRLLYDIAERFLWTFIQGATATFLLSGFLGVDQWKAGVVGGLSAVLALLKGVAAVHVGNPATAATLPATVEAVGTVAGQVVGQVVDATGSVVGDVTGTVSGTVEDALSILDDIEKKAVPKPRTRKKT